jgi:hypothetical protein
MDVISDEVIPPDACIASPATFAFCCWVVPAERLVDERPIERQIAVGRDDLEEGVARAFAPGPNPLIDAALFGRSKLIPSTRNFTCICERSRPLLLLF